MKYIWLIILGLMILGFAGASLFSGSLLAPAKPGPADLITPKVNTPEKQPEITPPSPASHQKQIPARDRNSQPTNLASNRSRKFEPLIVRRIPVSDAIRTRLESEARKSPEQPRAAKS